jgi:hypothetical protein
MIFWRGSRFPILHSSDPKSFDVLLIFFFFFFLRSISIQFWKTSSYCQAEHVFFLTNGNFFCARRFFISFAQMNISVSVILDTSVHFCTPWDNHVHALRFATNFHAAQFLIESVSSRFTYRQKSIPSKLQILDVKLKTRLLEQLWHRAADGKLVDLNHFVNGMNTTHSLQSIPDIHSF